LKLFILSFENISKKKILIPSEMKNFFFYFFFIFIVLIKPFKYLSNKILSSTTEGKKKKG
jgi:hypothetical protein